MKILVCGASGTEAKACERGIKASGHAELFEVLQTGVGFDRSSEALKKRLERAPRPDLIISTGLAGAISADIPLNTWVTALEVFSLDTANDNELKAIPLTRLRHSVHEAKGCNFISSAEVTFQDSDLASVYRKIPEPVVVDMESAILAEIAQDNGIDFMALRLISDTPKEPLPRFVSKIAAAMAERKPVSRLAYALQGATEAVRDPRGVMQMVKGGQKWSALLRDGWQKHAAVLAKLYLKNTRR